MKKFFILFVISFTLFSCTPETNVVISDVCEITQEICYYANLICDSYIPDVDASIISSKKINELKNYANDLKYIYADQKIFPKAQATLSDQQKKYKLIEIRDQLKRIYEQQSTLRH